jgi:26S proteasome regulatory subunit N3
VIEATIDHEHGWLASNEIIDVYSTEEPQKAFHRLMPYFLSSSIITHTPSLWFRRIVFCLDVHNEAVKGMRYPPDAYKKEIAGKGKEDDEKTIEELIKEMEDDMEDL